MSAKCAFFSIFQKIMVFCCAMFFGFANAFSANLPSGYTELEYIESTGTQYIDTGVVPEAGTHAKIKFAYMSTSGYGYAFGDQETGGHYFALRLNGSSELQFLAGGSGSGTDITPISGTPFTAELSVSGTSATYTINGVSNTETIQFSSEPGTRHIGVFANGNGESIFKSSARCYGFSVDNNGTMIRNMVPVKHSSGVIGMYDLVNDVFYTNFGTGTFTAGPVVPENNEQTEESTPIKIATTAYNSARFSPVVTDLNDTIATIRDVVTNTINQTAAIADLQATKQTRPADDYTDETNTENCPKFRQCLLVEDNNNIPHWYLIKDPVRDLVLSLKNNKVNNSGQTTSNTFAANGYDGTNGTVDSRYYKGYVAMRKLADGSTSVYTRQFGAALTGGDNGGQYKTLDPQEWAVTWDGNETGTAGSFMSGVIYGTSRCSKVKPSSTAVGTEGWNTIENSDPVNDAENIQSYVQCYCKMTGVGVDGEITPVRDSSRAPWVFNGPYSSAVDCARYCAFYCAYYVRRDASFRSAVLGFAAN